MRYVIADVGGKSHAYFDRRVEALDALRELIEGEPDDAIDEFYLAGFDESGVRTFGPQSARSALGSRGLPPALVVRELRDCARRYLTGKVGLAAVKEGIIDATRGLDGDEDYKTALDLRAEIERLIVEYPDEVLLRVELTALAPSWWALEVQNLAPPASSRLELAQPTVG